MKINSLFSRHNQLFISICLLVFVLAVFLRTWKGGLVPPGLYWDEVAMVVDIQAVLETGRDMQGNHWLQSIFVSYGDYKLPVYIWLATLSSALISVSEFAVRLPSLLAGLGTVVIAGLLAYELLTRFIQSKNNRNEARWIAVATAAVVATAPWSIMFSRTAFEGHLGQFLVACSLYCTLISRKKHWLLLVSAVLGSLAVNTYFSVRFVWPPVFIVGAALSTNWVALSIKKVSSWKQYARRAVFVVLSLGIFFASWIPIITSPYYEASTILRLSTPSILNDEQFVKDHVAYKAMSGGTVVDRILFKQELMQLRRLADNYADHINLQTLFVSGEPNLRHSTQQHGFFLLVFLPFFLVGVWCWATRAPAVFGFLCFWWLVAVLPASVPYETPHALRSLNALVPLSILIGGGLFSSFQHLQRFSQFTRQVIVTIICLGVVLCTVHFAHFYFVVYPQIAQTSWQDGYRELAESSYQLAGEDTQILVYQFDDRLYLWFMAYGPYSGAEFAQWQTEAYRFQSFENVTFISGQANQLLSSGQGRYVVVSTQEIITQLQQQYGFIIDESKNSIGTQYWYQAVRVRYE